MAEHTPDNLPEPNDFHSFQETLEYLYARLPMFTRIGAAALKADLSNTLELCERLDNPQDKFKSIHIAGTNGKGSTSHMLAAILQTAGYRTGLYTSPHLKDFRERIRINGKMIPEGEVVEFVNNQQKNIEEIDPSFFEVTVAMAFQYFAHQNVDIAVIEVGLGGRLDSTNIINPLVSVITNIGFDHVDILGDTLPQIAYEKAGIIKSKVPVIIGEKHPDTFKTFLEKAKQCNSELIFASEQWEVTRSNKSTDSLCMTLEVKSTTPLEYSELNFINIELDLTGLYQLKNLATVLSSVIQLRKAGFVISEGHIKFALKQVKNLTGLMGRWQIIKDKPLIICDTAHNEDGIREVLKNIEIESFDKLHIVIGMVKDKDINKVLSILPKNASYYFCHPNIPRAKPAEQLKEEALSYSLKGNSFESVAAAIKEAEKRAGENDLIFVGGSTFVVAEIM